MKTRAAAILSVLAAVACFAACGETVDTGDGGADARPDAACYSDPRTDAQRQCQTNADCAVVDHVASCCGSIVEVGIRGDQVNVFHNAETATNAGCPQCACPAAPTVDELGQQGGAYIASCDQGLCVAHAQ